MKSRALVGSELSIGQGKDTQFKKGQSGNHGGRPKAIISDWLRHELATLDSDTQEEIAQKIIRVLIQRAVAGDVKAIQIIADRVDGRPAQMETPNASQEPTKIVVEYIGPKGQPR
jgi:hypothetical protein